MTAVGDCGLVLLQGYPFGVLPVGGSEEGGGERLPVAPRRAVAVVVIASYAPLIPGGALQGFPFVGHVQLALALPFPRGPYELPVLVYLQLISCLQGVALLGQQLPAKPWVGRLNADGTGKVLARKPVNLITGRAGMQVEKEERPCQ